MPAISIRREIAMHYLSLILNTIPPHTSAIALDDVKKLLARMLAIMILDKRQPRHIHLSSSQHFILQCLREIMTDNTTLMNNGHTDTSHMNAVIRRMLRTFTEHDDESIKTLTLREKSVLVRIGRGQSMKEISNEFGISKKTCEYYRTMVCQKLGLRGTASLVHFAIFHGLVEVMDLDIQPNRSEHPKPTLIQVF